MRGPLMVYIATALLFWVTVRLAWIAVHIKNDSHYLVSKWQVVVFFFAVTCVFFLKPMIMRWVVAPYFLLTGLGGIATLSQMQMSWLFVFNLAIVVAQCWAGIKLFRLKAENSKLAFHSPKRD